MAQKPTPSTDENPRTTRIRDIVLQAVIELLVAEGAGAVTALRVSKHAGVARSTIYQHWPDQNNLLLDAIDRIMIPDVPTSITNNLEEDLTTALANLRRRMTKQPFRALFATLLDHANRDKAFVAPQRRFVNGVLQPIREILTAATQRGDLP
ncbi:MAG: TetR/AcrR family transcriptional regulator, partial [Acidobacteria bacterium]|nr:TetR/AcrR family transcriptional regulator [Acidobacteriota bacterium]